MKGLGGILAVIGIIVLILGVVNHFVKNFTGSTTHMSVILGVVGVVLLVIGVVLTMMPRKASA